MAVLGGTFIVNFMDFNEANLAGVFNAIGEAFFIVGKALVYAFVCVSTVSIFAVLKSILG